jgi:hypothetical protein
MKSYDSTIHKIDNQAVLPFRDKATGNVLRGKLLGTVDIPGHGKAWAVEFSDGVRAWWIDELLAKECGKCGGTGFFCTHILDGVPQSNTGYDCWKCGGTGWVESEIK